MHASAVMGCFCRVAGVAQQFSRMSNQKRLPLRMEIRYLPTITRKRENPPLYNYLAGKALGDLNKDGISDSVVVVQDTTDNTRPSRLQIFFGQADGSYTPVVTANTVIEPTYPLGSDGMDEGHRFDEVLIKNGALDIHTSLIHANVHHVFRYQNGHFELIGFSQDQLEDINTVSEEQYNLSTGQYIRYKEAPDGSGKSVVENRVIPAGALPVLDNFVPFTSKGEITY